MPMMEFGPITITNSTFYLTKNQQPFRLPGMIVDIYALFNINNSIVFNIFQHFSQELRSQLPAPPVLGEPLGPPVLPPVALGEAPGGAGQRPGLRPAHAVVIRGS